MAVITQTQADELLDPEFTTKLDQLELISRKIFVGKMRGERRSKRRGESVEFADYRNYVVGDDLRYLDWNIYARLESLFIKLFLEEEDLLVTVLLDVSKSMDWGNPHKGLYARRVAAAIAYIGLTNYDRVSLFAYSNGLRGELVGVRGRRLMFKAIEFLTNTPYMVSTYGWDEPPRDGVVRRMPFLIIRRRKKKTAFLIVHQPFRDKPEKMSVQFTGDVLTIQTKTFQDTLAIPSMRFTRTEIGSNHPRSRAGDPEATEGTS